MRYTRARVSVAAAVAAVVCLTACSSGKSSSSTSSAAGGSSAASNLPAKITIPSITDLTGSSSFAGIAGETGTQLAVSQINDQHYLGANTTLAVDTKDAATLPQTAASDFTEAVADKSIPAVLGSITSSESQAVAPIAMQSQLPVAFTQSGSTGTILGAYTFRLTAPASTYFGSVLKPWLASKNVKTASVLYSSQNPTLAQLAQSTLPQIAKSQGFTIASSTGVQTNTVDYSAAVSKIVSDKPQVVFLLLVGTQYSTVVTQLHQAGYSGAIAAQSAAGTGNLKAAGAAGVGVVYPVDFLARETGASSQAFTAAYKAKYGTNPTYFAAERYDALWFIARAIKLAGSTDRAPSRKR